MALRLLVRGHLRSRWRRYALVAANAALGFIGFFVVVMVTQGANDAVLRPLEAVFSGDVRVTQGSSEVPARETFDDYRPIAARLDRVPGADVSPRLESSFITVRAANLDRWAAGLLLGVDPDSIHEQHALGPYITWGRAVDSVDVIDPATGVAYPPLVLGAASAHRLNLTLNETGAPDFGTLLTLTSGRLVGGGNAPFPITVECVVVGVFETGLDPLDKFTGFVPIQTARVLLGHAEADPVANAIIVHGGDPDAVLAVARDDASLRAVTSHHMAFDYLGSILVILYGVAFIGLSLFFAVLMLWLLHETAVLVRVDQAIISTLRAIGVPMGAIAWSYSGLVAAAVAVGALAAMGVTALLGLFAPPIRLSSLGFEATIPWEVRPLAVLLVGVAAVLTAAVAGWAATRRIQRLNILDGLRPT